MQYESLLAVCPYYLRHLDNRICCEGSSKSNRFNVTFEDAKKRDEYSHQYCNNMEGCRNCLIHQALNNKYGII